MSRIKEYYDDQIRELSRDNGPVLDADYQYDEYIKTQPPMKKIGIVADSYKLEKFKKELTDKGFTDFEVKQYTKDVSTIYVQIQEDQLTKIADICRRVELYFKTIFNRN